MNKWKSFFISLVVASLIGFIANRFHQLVDMPRDMFAPFLIFWYMLWKLFHDKNKDQ